MNPTYEFKGQVALVTGASTGIGLATAQAFAQFRAAVVLADRNEKALAGAVTALKDAGHQAIGVPCNVADEAQAAAMVERTVAAFGRLDMAYNNAGILGPMCPMMEETAAGFDEVNAVNLRGVWTCMKHELLQMKKQGGGAIVNCSSLGGLVGLPGRAAYHATKYGVIGLTKSAALDVPQRASVSMPSVLAASILRWATHGHEGISERTADRPNGTPRGSRGGSPLAVQPRREHGARRRTASRRRVRGSLK